MPSKRALVTGCNGFVGSHLVELLTQEGWQVHGTVRSFRSDLENLEDLRVACRMPTLHSCDITDGYGTARVVRDVKPDAVWHLAASSYVPDSWTNPAQVFNVNVTGTLNMLEAVRQHAPEAKMLTAGTSEEFGKAAPDSFNDEETPLRPLSPYGVSKVAADLLTQQYAASYGVHAIVTRAHNHSGARRGFMFAESNWARQIALAELTGKPGIIRHGNLEAVRDYTDVRDIVRGYLAAVEMGKSGDVYVLATGVGLTMRDVLERLVSMSGVPMTAEPDPARMRPSDVPFLRGNPAKAARELGWTPRIPATDMLRDLLDYWRSRVRNTRREIVKSA